MSDRKLVEEGYQPKPPNTKWGEFGYQPKQNENAPKPKPPPKKP